MIYDIVRNFASKNISILITTSFLLAYNSASHGLIVNGMWLESGFYPASLSAIGILAGIRFLFKESNILAGFAFAFSIIAHQLYGITALAFIFPGLIFNYYESSKKGKLLNLIKVFLPSLFVIFYHFYFRSLIDVNIEITHSFLEWYKFTVYLIQMMSLS